jgi:hypothetical protein
MKILILLLFIFTYEASSKELRLLDFKTDNCTFFPEGTVSKPDVWKDCCVSHDLWYWVGGTSKEQDQADLDLKSCVTRKSSSFYGNLMYQGVRLGHLSPIKSEYRWSWGWAEESREFQALTTDEKNKAKQLLRDIGKNQKLANDFIKYILK